MSQRKKTFVALVIDASSSMQHLSREVVDTFNGFLDTLKNAAREPGQQTMVCVVQFADHPKTLLQPIPVQEVKPLTYDLYRPNGWTALFDGVGHAVTLLDTQGYTNNDDVAFLAIVITDGEENRSMSWNATKIKEMIERKQATGEWTFGFNVPRGYRNSLVRLGIPEDNVREWEANVKGVVETHSANTNALQSYFDDRHSGKAKATRNFYQPVTTNLAKVDPTKIKSTLEDLSNRFRSYAVEKEASVEEFIKVKTGRPYIIGSTYYQLMKSEKIQPSKAVLIVEKGKKAVWGGPDARKLIGLPLTEHARVTPGNHSDYEIFVQSTSLNRKLPRGTKVMVDTLLAVNLPATWLPDPAKATTP